MTQVNWYGKKVAEETTAKAWKRVMQAASYLKARIQQNVDIATAAAGPSRPGEYPHKVTGTLQKSIFLRPRRAELACDVGTKLVYGVHWETTNRPYIRRTYAEQIAQIKAILEGRMTRTIEDVRAEASAIRARHQEQKATIQGRKKTAREVKQISKKARRAETKARQASKKVSDKLANLQKAKQWAAKQKTKAGKEIAKKVIRSAKAKARGSAKSATRLEKKARDIGAQAKSKKDAYKKFKS